MIIENVRIYTEQGEFCFGTVVIENGKIADIKLGESADFAERCKNYCKEDHEILDGRGKYLIPGMIDIHLHGCKGYDFCDGSLEAVKRIAEYQASTGVTTMALATMTLPTDRLQAVLEQGAAYCEKKSRGEYAAYADLAGINMEGPFISKEKCGAQNAEYIKKPQKELFEALQESAKGLVKYMGIAPEAEGALEFIRKIKDQIKLSIAHSNACYEEARAAFEAGACHVTHLYNGMSAFSHREPGIVGAVYDCKEIEVELIADGVHVHPSMIRATFQMLGKDRVILISDSIRAAGMEPGEYELGGQKIKLQKNRAVISGTKTIAGSVASLPEGLRYVVKETGIPLEVAVQCVTKNPARSLGIYEECGSVSVGKRADLVLLDEDLNVTAVVKNGVLI